jgi:hypothetical protein
MFMPIAAILLTAGLSGTLATLAKGPTTAPEPRTVTVATPAPARTSEIGVFLAAND